MSRLAGLLGAVLLGLIVAKKSTAALSLAAWGIILAVVGLLAAVGIVLATSDDDPEIGAIQIRVENAGASDWYVGQLRVVSVGTDVSFGHIRGDDVGVITLEVDFDGDVAYRETRRYTEKNDGDPNTETLGRWEGTIRFGMEVEARDHGVGTIGAKVIVDGESNGLFTDPAASVSGNTSLPVDVLFPLEIQSGSGAIGWLSPPSETILHHECFDQTLQVRNRATVEGEVGSATISQTTAEHIPFGKASGNLVASETDIVTGSVGHDNVLIYGNAVDFSTDWSLQGSGNLRVFLRSTAQWSNNGGTGPSSQSNTCQGGTLNYSLVNVSIPPTAHNVNADYALEILSRNGPSRAGSSRNILVSDDSAFSQTRSTDSAGIFNIAAPALGPLVTLDLVTGSDSPLFEDKVVAAVNAALFDDSAAPTFDTFYIFEREAPAILGLAVDGLGNPMTVDLFAVGVDGEENDLGRFTGAIDIPGGLDAASLGYPTALFRIRAVAAFNRAYLKPELEIGLPASDATLDLGTLVFAEVPPALEPLIFRGRFEIRDPEGANAEALSGLLLEVQGVGTVQTDPLGAFEIVVPGGGPPRIFRLMNPETIATSAGNPVSFEGLPQLAIEFGRSGSTLDLGNITLHSTETPVEVPMLPPVSLALLALLLPATVFLYSRRMKSRSAA